MNREKGEKENQKRTKNKNAKTSNIGNDGARKQDAYEEKTAIRNRAKEKDGNKTRNNGADLDLDITRTNEGTTNGGKRKEGQEK